MCSIILCITPDGVQLAANRDESLSRPWDQPAQFWPNILAGRDRLAGGTWLALNRHGVVAAVLNRSGTLGPAPDKRSRGELPILALAHPTATAGTNALAALDTALYRSFNLVIADPSGAFLLRGLESGPPDISPLPEGVTMITSTEPNDLTQPRIARHLPKFQATGFAQWETLVADSSGPWESSLNISEHNGFGTVCSSLIILEKNHPPFWRFADTSFDFHPVTF